MDESPKWMLASRTMWALVLAALPVVLPWVGISWSEENTRLLDPIFDAGLTFVGLLLAAWFRYTASRPLTVAPPDAPPSNPSW